MNVTRSAPLAVGGCLGLALLCAVPGGAEAAQEGAGDPNQFYSGWTAAPPDVTDGVMDTTPAEWQSAFVRRIALVDGNGVMPEAYEGYLFAMNDADNLYVAINYESRNQSDNNDAIFYVDEGLGGGDRDGVLTDGQETAFEVGGNGSGGGGQRRVDYVLSGGAWVVDSTAQNVSGASSFENMGQVWRIELSIPINAADAEDLQVNDPGDGLLPGREIGLLVKVDLAEVGYGNYVIQGTNGDRFDPTAGDGWLDLRLGAPRNLVTFGATKNVKGNPVVDGDLSDLQYVGCYQRDLVLTNFVDATENVDARAFVMQDSVNRHIYVGLRVFDENGAGTDAVRIYQEQKPGPDADGRDTVLDDGRENALNLTEAGVLTDWRYDDASSPDHWVGDTIAGNLYDCTAAVGYDGSLGAWEFEFRLDYDTSDIEDFDVLDSAIAGFTIRYTDGDIADAAMRELWWDHTVNSDAVLVNQANGTVLAVGWAELLLGAPFVQIMHPVDGSTITGSYPLDVYVEADAGVTIDAVGYQFVGATVTDLVALDQVANSQYWVSDIDTLAVPDGQYELRVCATYTVLAQTYFVTQVLTTTVANTGAGALLPAVAITAPAAGEAVSGAVDIAFDIDPQGGASIVLTEVSVDCGDWAGVTSEPTSGVSWDDGYHSVNTLAMANGSHVARIRALDSNGLWGFSDLRLFVVSNGLDVSITAPQAGSVVSDGEETIEFDVVPEPGETVAEVAISIDGEWLALPADDRSYVWSTLSCANGSHAIQVRARDLHERVGFSDIVTLVVSNDVMVTVTSPAAGSTVSGTGTIAFEIDPESGETIGAVEVSLDGGPWTTVTDMPTSPDWDDGSHEWDTLAWPNGSHSIQVRASDSGCRWGYSQIVLVVVENDLSVRITAPDAGSVVSGQVAVEFQVYVESGETVTSAEASVDGADWLPVTTPPTAGGSWADGSHLWDTAALKDGAHSVTVRVADSHGRAALSLPRQLFADNSGPAIGVPAVGYPYGENFARTGDQVVVEAEISDAIAGVDPSTVFLDSTAADGQTHALVDDGSSGDAVAGDGVYSCAITVTARTDGVAAVLVTATDAAGNASGPVRGRISVLNAAVGAGCSPSRSGPGWLVLVLAGYAAACSLRRHAVRPGRPGRPAGRTVQRLILPMLLVTLLPVMVPAKALAYDSPRDTALRSPISLTGANFLQALVLQPALESPAALPAGALEVEAALSTSRESWYDVSGASSIDTEADLNLLTVSLSYGLTDAIELRGSVPYVTWDGRLQIIKSGESILDSTDLRPAVGSPTLGGKFSFLEGSLAATAAVKMPSGSEVDYASTGGTDLAFGFLTCKQGQISLYAGLGATFVGQPTAFRPEAEVEFRDIVYWGGAAVTYAATDRLSVVLQIQGGDTPMEAEGLDGLQPFREGPWHFVGGVRLAGEKAGLEVAAGARLGNSGSDWVAQGRFQVATF
jgi:hypothetical protein